MSSRSGARPEPDDALDATAEDLAAALDPDMIAVARGASASSGTAEPDASRPPDLETMPVPGITPRRVAFVMAAIVSAWIVIVFARQVGEAATATGRADEAVARNAALTADVAGLQRELATVQQQTYILQQARGHRLGMTGEIPFTLSADAPTLAADAPGSATQALGSDQDRSSPLETWLRLLFGPGPEG